GCTMKKVIEILETRKSSIEELLGHNYDLLCDIEQKFAMAADSCWLRNRVEEMRTEIDSCEKMIRELEDAIALLIRFSE
ncbi:hypothetical protein, partial [Sulfoacidibacillus thermotolerans]